MPRKKKKSSKKKEPEAPKSTYHKSKNGRFFRKTKLPSGKTQCRFVSKAEGEAGYSAGSSEPKKKQAEE